MPSTRRQEMQKCGTDTDICFLRRNRIVSGWKMIISMQHWGRSAARLIAAETGGWSLTFAIDRLAGVRRRLFRTPCRSRSSCSRSRPRGTLGNWDEMFTGLFSRQACNSSHHRSHGFTGRLFGDRATKMGAVIRLWSRAYSFAATKIAHTHTLAAGAYRGRLSRFTQERDIHVFSDL